MDLVIISHVINIKVNKAAKTCTDCLVDSLSSLS